MKILSYYFPRIIFLFSIFYPLISYSDSAISYDGRIELKLIDGWEEMKAPSPEVTLISNKETREGFNLNIITNIDSQNILNDDLVQSIKLELKPTQKILKDYIFKNQHEITLRVFKINDGRDGRVFIHIILLEEGVTIYRMVGSLANNEKYEVRIAKLLNSIKKVTPQIMKAKAQKGNHLDQFNYGQYLLENVGFNEALLWFKKSANNGSTKAMILIGSYYQHGYEGNFKRDFLEAEKWYSKAAETNDPGVLWALAWSYQSEFLGKGAEYEKYKIKKFKYLEKAANGGFKLAQRDLINSYLIGEGIEKNPAKAKEIMFKFGEQGNEVIQFHIARLFLDSTTNQRVREAFGLKLNREQGIKWLEKAVENGHPNARKILDQLKK